MSATGAYTRQGPLGGPKDQHKMLVCRTCGSTFKDCVDFCFYDGEVLVSADAVADPVEAPPAPGATAQQQGAQPTYEPVVAVTAPAPTSPAPTSPAPTPSPAPPATAPQDAPVTASNAQAPEQSPADAVTVTDEAAPESTDSEQDTIPPLSEADADTPITPIDHDEPFDEMPVAELHDPAGSPDDDTVPPLPVAPIAVTAEREPTPPEEPAAAAATPTPSASTTQPITPPTPARPQTRSPRPASRSMTFEAEEDPTDRGSMIAVGAVALFLGIVFIIGAGVAALTMGSSALLDRGEVADGGRTDAVAPVVPVPLPTPAPSPTPAPQVLGDPVPPTPAPGLTPPAPAAPAPAPPTPVIAAPPPAPAPVVAPAPAAPVPVAPAPAPASNDGAAVVQPQPPSPPPVTQGTVTFDSLPPGADIIINGVVVTTTPGTATLDFATYDYRVKLDGYADGTGRVTVDKATFKAAKIELTKVAAAEPAPTVAAGPPEEIAVFIFLEQASAATLFVDGNAAPVLPARMTLAPGPHQFLVQCGGTKVFSGRVTVVPTGVTTLVKLHDMALVDPEIFIEDVATRKALCEGGS